MKYLLSIALISTLFFSFVLIQNQRVTCEVQEDYTMIIKGSSNVHDWESTVEDITGTASITYTEAGGIQIDECKVKIPVKSIKSSKGKRMDKNTMKALNEKEYPTIEYVLTSFDNIVQTGNSFTAVASGDLNLSGAKRNIKIDIKGSKLDNGALEISGMKDMKMTDFNIDPPTALLGTMKTKDEITIEFRVVLGQAGS